MLPAVLRQLPTPQLLEQGQGHTLTADLHGAKKILQQAKLDQWPLEPDVRESMIFLKSPFDT